jgi:hypothetical protein
MCGMKRHLLQLFTFIFAAVIISGCSTPSSKNQSVAVPSIQPTSAPRTVQPQVKQPEPDPRNQSGLLLSDARERTMGLERGMSQGDVESLFGAPDGTIGPDDRNQRNIAWFYQWEQGGGRRTLNILFKPVTPEGSNWVVNSWRWY